jgi:small-conductance mechanosensitive channel
MNETLHTLAVWFRQNLPMLVRAGILLAMIPAVHAAASMLARTLRRKLSLQSLMLATKGFKYAGTGILILMFLHEVGFNLSTVLGAAGIAGVAFGFASQTSLSNLISGLFLVVERPFEVGDLLQVGGTSGVVHSIDLLSVKLRTFDNRFVRLPNETLIKTEFTNITRFPIRRLDIDLGVAYKEDIGRVMRVLGEIADRNPFALDEPAPLILFKGFGASALDILFGVWFEKQDMLNLRNSIMRDIKERFDREGIEIPFPHRTLYAGSDTAPFPVRVVENQATSARPEPGETKKGTES